MGRLYSRRSPLTDTTLAVGGGESPCSSMEKQEPILVVMRKFEIGVEISRGYSLWRGWK